MGRLSYMNKGIAYMLAATFLYALLNFTVKKLSHIPPAELVWFRSVISLMITLVWLHYRRIPKWGNNKQGLLLRGGFGVCSLLLFFYTLQTMPMASVMAIQYVSPVFTALLAVLVLEERMRVRQWLFLGLCLCGVLLIHGADNRITFWGLLAGLASALFSALAYSSVRSLSEREHPLVMVLYFPIVAIPVTTLALPSVWVTPAYTDWWLLILMGLLTQAAQTSMTFAIQEQPLTKISYLNYLGILYAWIIGFIWFDETYSYASYAGMGLVIAGVLLNLFAVPKDKKEPNSIPIDSEAASKAA